ncbi:transporter substrate-binding domain-containing protein [Methylocella sp.]|uniref:transporter substrate-binding domain-containing protein n=1 Tax=Methylocella sp. TaxID=1978226 RepID=UPI00378496DD
MPARVPFSPPRESARPVSVRPVSRARPASRSGAARRPGAPSGPLLALLVALLPALPGLPAATAHADPFTPNFFDPNARPDKPDLGAVQSLRFLTDRDFPPFHYEAEDGTLKGFDVDLARALCDSLKLTCTIQARRYDTLADALDKGEGDAILGSLRIDAKSREKFDFSAPYAKTPARFARRRENLLGEATPETLRGKFVGVVAKSAHEAYLDAFFPGATRKAYDSPKALTEALKAGEVDAIFMDGVALSFWLRGPEAEGCCAFSGGPYMESRFFGEGLGIALKKGDPALREALDHALASLFAKGVAADLYLKYFPLGYY